MSSPLIPAGFRNERVSKVLSQEGGDAPLGMDSCRIVVVAELLAYKELQTLSALVRF